MLLAKSHCDRPRWDCGSHGRSQVCAPFELVTQGGIELLQALDRVAVAAFVGVGLGELLLGPGVSTLGLGELGLGLEQISLKVLDQLVLLVQFALEVEFLFLEAGRRRRQIVQRPRGNVRRFIVARHMSVEPPEGEVDRSTSNPASVVVPPWTKAALAGVRGSVVGIGLQLADPARSGTVPKTVTRGEVRQEALTTEAVIGPVPREVSVAYCL